MPDNLPSTSWLLGQAASELATLKALATLLVLCFLALLSACTPRLPLETSSPTPSPSTITRSQSPAPTALPTRGPTRVPPATTAPTVDPVNVAQIAEEGQAALSSRQVDPLCLRWEDTDGDGEPEWVGLTLRPTNPPRLEGFVLDGEAWHELTAPAEDDFGLGTYPACDLEVRDINVDGRAELLIFGHAAEHVNLLHIFVWRETTYVMLASFRGDAGIDVRNIDGELAEEVVARWDAGKGLAWEQVHTWDGAHYGWTWERYTWLHSDYPHAYPTDDPERTIISFYLALRDRDLPAAYDLLRSEVEPSGSYESWAAGFDTMLSVEVGSVHEIKQTDGTAMVTAQVRSYDNFDGYVVGRLWDVTWTVVRQQEAWQLEHSSAEELDRWEATYFP